MECPVKNPKGFSLLLGGFDHFQRRFPVRQAASYVTVEPSDASVNVLLQDMNGELMVVRLMSIEVADRDNAA
jgi:hypothetical protein